MKEFTVINNFDNMNKIAIIGASYLQLPLVEKAKEMEIETHCFAWDKGAVAKETADFFYPVSIVEKEAILEKCKEIGIDGICTIASDVAAPTVAYVAQKLGLNANSYESSLKANNKFLMREALSQAGVKCPRYSMFRSAKETEGNDFKFPLIVKPSDRSGSLGVSKVHNHEELRKAVDEAVSFSFKGEAMVEEFIEGREISVEFISYHGVHYPLQITDKVTTGAPHFVELEHHQPADLTEAQFKEIYNITRKALDALGLTDGASHSEYKITENGDIYVMEIGGRMGGDFIGSDLVRLSTGYDFVKGVIEVSLGKFEKPEVTKSRHSGVYFLSKETENLKEYIEHRDDYPQIVKAEITDDELREIHESSDRSGYFIYDSDKRWICR